VKLITEYRNTFPQLFAALEVQPDSADTLDATKIWPGEFASKVKDVQTWLRHQEVFKLPRVPVGTEALPIAVRRCYKSCLVVSFVSLCV
jgi:hypothetical protein